MDAPQKTALLVLGMHRSGTSSLAGTLVKLGATAPKTLHPAQMDNERGFFESVVLMHINIEILGSAASDWHDWRAFDKAWFESASAEEFEEKAAAALVDEFGLSRLIVVKDPRICRIMPFWTKVLHRAGFTTRVIIPVRSPLEVARSLQKRDRFPMSKSLLLWLRHVLDAEAASRNVPRAVIDWPNFLADWRLAAVRMEEQIGVSWPGLSDLSANEIDDFLTPSLRHFVVTSENFAVDPEVSEWVRIAYGAMCTLAVEPTSSTALQALDNIRAEFDKASTIFGRALVECEMVATNAQTEANALRSERDRLQGEATEHRARADALAAELDVVIAERAFLAEHLAAAVADRDRLSGEVTEHRARADALAAEPDAALTERGTLSEQLR